MTVHIPQHAQHTHRAPLCRTLPDAAALNRRSVGDPPPGTAAWAPYYSSAAASHWEPENLLYGYYNETLTAHSQTTCVAYDSVSNRNAVAADDKGNQFLYADFPRGCVGKQCALSARVQLDEITDEPIEEATLTYRCAATACRSCRPCMHVCGPRWGSLICPNAYACSTCMRES